MSYRVVEESQIDREDWVLTLAAVVAVTAHAALRLLHLAADGLMSRPIAPGTTTEWQREGLYRD